MFKPPALMPVFVMEGPLLIVKPLSVILVSPIVKEPSGVRSTFLFKENSTAALPLLLVCLMVMFLPACISTVLPSRIACWP